MNNNNYFPDLIGQNAVKKKLSFYLDAFDKTGTCPFLNLVGAKGLGKTEFAKAFAKNLYNDEGDRRAFLELNCSTIKNNEQRGKIFDRNGILLAATINSHSLSLDPLKINLRANINVKDAFSAVISSAFRNSKKD